MARRPSPIGPALLKPRTDITEAARVEKKPFATASKSAKARGVFLGGYVDLDTKMQFKQLLLKRRLTEQAALEEMLDDYFSKHGVHRIASLLGSQNS